MGGSSPGSGENWQNVRNHRLIFVSEIWKQTTYSPDGVFSMVMNPMVEN